jgi:DnaJ family protein B protein 12
MCPIGGGFDTGGFVFNMGGGGPGVRVHQFGGGRPRRRPGTAAAAGQEQQPPSASSALSALLPLLFLFILPLLSSLFGGSTPNSPSVVFDNPRGAYSQGRTSNKLNVPYWVNPAEVKDYSRKEFRKLDDFAENKYIHTVNVRCEHERHQQQKLREEAMGWLSNDEVKMEKARKMPMPNCRKLRDMGFTHA